MKVASGFVGPELVVGVAEAVLDRLDDKLLELLELDFSSSDPQELAINPITNMMPTKPRTVLKHPNGFF